MYSEYQNNPDTRVNDHWNILIVDDDIDIHAVTEFALKGVRINERNINFLHAYTGSEAIDLFRKGKEKIDLIFLDMVMETQDAGLKVATWLHNQVHLIEKPIVILRTGQPGKLSIKTVLATGMFDGMIEKSNVTYRYLINYLSSMLPVKIDKT